MCLNGEKAKGKRGDVKRVQEKENRIQFSEDRRKGEKWETMNIGSS